MKTPENPENEEQPELIASPMGLIDPNDFTHQRDQHKNDDDVADEPLDDDGDPTGEHDHHQDDNYYLGGHVTRSSGI